MASLLSYQAKEKAFMKVLEIKGIVPGAGKTTVLTNLSFNSHLANKIILTPTNQRRQGCINILIELGMDAEEAEKSVKTLRKFKHNYYERKSKTEYFDTETTEWKEHVDTIYTTTHSKKHFKKVWNIFIDEASMISKEEMDDLLQNWRIHNLVLDGDSNQFEPIGSSFEMKLYEKTESVWLDNGELYSVEADNQILLNKSMRARDPILKKAIELIKAGNVIDGLIEVLTHHKPKNCENKPTDWHIAYTNNKCDHLNQMYEHPRRFIVTHNDNIHGFSTSEILDIDDRRLMDLERTLMYEGLKDPNVPSFDEWKKNYLKPAYAVTCHKLQGTTISEGDIFIHIDDILFDLQKLDAITDRAKLFQKFLYIAISRAVSVDQINIYGLGDVDLLTCIQKSKAGMRMYDSVADEICKLQENMGPLVDKSIREDAVEFAADDEKLLEYALGCLSYDEKDVGDIEGAEEYLEEISKAHSVTHKPHKPHKRKEYPQEWKDAAKVLGQKEWCSKYTNQPSLYQRLKKEV